MAVHTVSLVFFLALRAVDAQSSYVFPKAINATTGSVSNAEALLAPNSSVATLSGKGAQIVLDYGVDVGGFPTLWLHNVEGESVQMAATYSEGWGGVWMAEGESFVDYSDGYSNNRTVTYNLTATSDSIIQDYYLQGSQRWQRIWLITDGTVSLSAIGFRSITDTTAVDSLPGGFKSSNDLFTYIWEAGARTVQLVSDPAGSIPPNWMLQDDGALIPPQYASPNLYGTLWANYTLGFQAKITGGGIGWQVLNSGMYGLQFELNRTHIGVFYGSGPANGTQGGSSGPVSYPLTAIALPHTSNLTLFDGDFHHYSTVILNPTISVSIDNVSILNFTVPEANVSTMAVPGSFGFGGAFDAEAVFTGVRVTDTLSGALLYESDLKSETALDDFAVRRNLVDSILDGARRDRIVWIGDVAITAPSLFYSTAEAKYVTGSLSLVSSWQNDTGALATDVPPIAPFGDSYPVKPANFFYSLPYEIFGLQAFHDTYMYTGNVSFIEESWSNIQAQTDRLLGLMGTNDSLIRIDESNSTLGMDWDYYDGPRYGAGTKLNSQAVLAFKQTSIMASALNHTSLAATYADASIAMRDAINAHLWNATGGFYVNTDVVPGVAQDANSWAVLAGVADAANRTEATLTAMAENLETDYGMLAFSADAGSRANISPFVSGFHLEALLMSDIRDADVLYILDRTFGTMLDPSRENYTGTLWEVMSPDGTPGIDAYTSLCHGWSTAPTALFSRFVLGVQPTSAGFKTWVVAPQPLNTTSAEGRVSTPYGTLSVNWTISDGVMTVEVDGPDGTNGTVYLTAGSESTITVDGENSTTLLLDRTGRLGVNVQGGATHVVQVL